MTNPIRTKRHHHIRMAKLDAGYQEQRAWFSVGMQRHSVTLRCEPWAELPLVVTYRTENDQGNGSKWEKRFTRAEIDDARDLFKVAGQPNRWPFDKTTVQSLNEKEN